MFRILALLITVALMAWLFLTWAGQTGGTQAVPATVSVPGQPPVKTTPAAVLNRAKAVTSDINEKNRALNKELESLER